MANIRWKLLTILAVLVVFVGVGVYPILAARYHWPSPGWLQEKQLKLGFEAELEEAEESGSWGQKGAPSLGTTVLDRVHPSMLLFSAGRSEALKRFLVEEGVGRDARFWRLAQALSALFPKQSDEKRWVDGVLTRKKGLGF